MLIFDQLKKNDPQLRAVALLILGGLGVLCAGLWWVQIVSSRDYQADLEMQSYRTVRIPAVRGKVLDRNGAVLAENRPTYNVSLYLEDLREWFKRAYSAESKVVKAGLKRRMEEQEKKLDRRLTKQERKQFTLSAEQRSFLQQKVRYQVASNVVVQVSQRLQQPLWLNPTNFERHYETRLALPYTVLPNLDPARIARFEEQMTSPLGVDLEIQSTRFYPNGTIGAHILGYLRRDDSSMEGEEAFFSYRLPDFRGAVGIEFGYDKELRGTAGAKSVVVNNLGYRQTENIWIPAEPGHNVVTTLDLDIQKAAEEALRDAPVKYAPPVRGAVVVMDVQTGDVLAMASSPTFDPSIYVRGVTRAEWQRITELQAEKNRATYEHYAPGSVFKIVVGLAALEAGLDPNKEYEVAPHPAKAGKGVIYVGANHHPITDLAAPGHYNFRRALMRSSNAYFIYNGLRIGPERIVRLGQKFHFGERTGIPTRQDGPGSFPTLKRVTSGWTDGNTANLCIGQDPVLMTPLQVAVLTSAVANGGKVLWPRLVARIESQDPLSGEPPLVFPSGQVRDELGVSARSMELLHKAMLADTEDLEGTGKKAAVPGLHICGKTGTAQIQDEEARKTGQTTWFASFASYGNPRYAVVVMVEDGIYGGDTCAPVARKVYQALLERDQRAAGKKGTLAKAE